MKKTLLGLSALLLIAPSALAAVQLEPVAQSQQQSDAESLHQINGQMTVSLRPVSNPGDALVFHPNGGGRLSENFSPYAFKNIVNTQVFQLTIQNNEGRTIEADQLKLSVSLDGLPYDYFDRDALIKQWRHYYYLNTNTITGAPDFMEQERAIVAEHYIEQHSFRPQDIPPGGQLTGFVAVPALAQSGMLKFRIRNLDFGTHPQDFTFSFNAKNS